MAEKNEQIDAIYHLLKIEKSASALIEGALKESEEQIGKAHSEYNLLYKEKYEKIIENLKSKYETDLLSKKKEYAEEIEAYKKELENKNQNDDDFFKLLDKLLFV